MPVTVAVRWIIFCSTEAMLADVLPDVSYDHLPDVVVTHTPTIINKMAANRFNHQSRPSLTLTAKFYSNNYHHLF